MPLWAWGGFVALIVALLALDLGVFRKKSREIRMKEALGWCGVWFSLALGFNGLIWWQLGSQFALEWSTAYLIELCLSVDNVFLIFTYFKVPPQYQHRVLFWGIVGAAVMRFVFILAGVGLLERFHWLIYVFGAFLVVTGIKMALPKKEEFEPEKNIVLRLFRRFYPVSSHYDQGRCFTLENGRRAATPLFLVLLIIETSDLAFALDSIPAVLAISHHAFIVFTSNIFAILGLRSLYFALQGVMGLFRYLAFGLAAILVFIGSKMLLTSIDVHIPIGFSLGVIASVLTVSVIASLAISPASESEAAAVQER
jgi:tellurite resistance protein TerC